MGFITGTIYRNHPRKNPKKATPSRKKLTPLFPNTKLESGKTYRLPQKRGSRGKGTRHG